MPRELLLVPPTLSVEGARPIGPGYPKDYTPRQMRGWAEDTSRLYRVREEDRALPPGRRRLDRWLACPREERGPDAQRVLDVQERLFADPGQGIRGTLRSDGSVGLDAGSHRAHYLRERGEPIPVWVTADDARQLAAFRTRCERELAQARPLLYEDTRGAPRARTVGALALERSREQSREAVVRGVGDKALSLTQSREAETPLGCLGRNAMSDEPERPPEYHLHGERAEPTRERGVSRPERVF